MVAKMTQDVDETIKEAFFIFDADGSGSISTDEFREVGPIQLHVFYIRILGLGFFKKEF